MSEKKLDLKKIAIIALPIIVSFFIFIIFFKNEEKKNEDIIDTLLIPDSESEQLPESKREIYEREKQEKREKIRENEESQITSTDFFNQVTNEDDQEETILPDIEKQKRIELLFSNNDTESSAVFTKPTKKKWDVEQVEDPLEEYDFEKKKKQKHTVPKKKTEKFTEQITQKKEETPVLTNIPGKRSRNNNITKKSDKYQEGNLIPAMIHSDQIIKNGSTVKMRLIEELYINEQKIPRNSFIYGIARFNQERVDIEINAIRLGNNIIPFKKQVLDQDGIKGLYFPENVSNQMSKEVGSDAIDEAYDIATSGTGIIGSVLSAGKSVMKKKNSEKKVNLKANYKIYIK